MKKVFFALLIILAISSFCSAQLSSVRADETKTFIGVIKSFNPAMGRPPKWYAVRFTAAADNTEKKEFWILGLSGASPTSVTDSEGKPMDKPGYNHRPQIGKKVEVKYSIAQNGHNDAVSVRYVPADYTAQPAASPTVQAKIPETPVNTAGANTFIGKILKGGVTFSLRCPYRFVIVLDNGEKKDIWIPKGNLRITDVNGKSVYGAPPRARKRMEVKYSIGDNGQYEAVSMRYVPADYVGEPTTQGVPAANAPKTAVTNASTANTFTGTIELVQATMHRQLSHPFCKITVVSADGQKEIFFVPGTSPVFDASGKDLSEGGVKVGALFLKKGQRVQVQYSTITNGNIITNGKLGADLIRLLD